jgi:hypothetical protein
MAKTLMPRTYGAVSEDYLALLETSPEIALTISWWKDRSVAGLDPVDQLSDPVDQVSALSINKRVLRAAWSVSAVGVFECQKAPRFYSWTLWITTLTLGVRYRPSGSAPIDPQGQRVGRLRELSFSFDH